MAGAGTGRDDWIAAAMTLLGRGASPAEMDVDDLCAVMPHPVTRGSFNWHFRAGRLAALRRAVISRWLDDRIAAAGKAREKRDPLDRLRILRDAADACGPGDSAMRRWAAAPERSGASETEQDVRRQLAAAIARADDVTTALLDEALTDLGLSGREAAAAAATLAAAFAAWPLAPPAPDAFEDMLAVLRRAAAPDAAREVQVIDGAGGEVLLVLAARNLPAGQLGELREAARQVLGLAGQHAGHDQPAGEAPAAGG